MEILDLRHFSSGDLRPLLDEEIEVWAKLLSWDYRSSADMILRYVDARILPGYAAIERGHICGYAFFVYEGSKGVIGDLFVGSRDRLPNPSEVESRLLLHVIETLQQSPGINRVEAQLLTHETGAVANMFGKHAFSQHKRIFMVLRLSEPQRQIVPMDKDIEIKRWSEHEYQAAAAVITAAYKDHVDAQINDQYRTLSGSLRFLNNIVRFPGCGTFDPESSFIAFHRRAKSVVGLILCSRVRQDVGHVTQICVLPEFRSHGIGEALLAVTAANLRQRAFSLLSLTVTEGNVRAVELYKHLGFDTKRAFDAFVWQG